MYHMSHIDSYCPCRRDAKQTNGAPSLPWQLFGAAQSCVEILAQRSCVIHRQKVTVLCNDTASFETNQ